MRKQLSAITYIRCIATIMIVLFHCLCYNGSIWKGIYPDYHYMWLYCIGGNFLRSLALPIFFITSGYLYGYLFLYKGKYKDNSFLINKIKRLFIPCVFWGGISIWLFPNICFLKDLLWGEGHLWFLNVLLMFFLVIHLIKTFLQKTPLYVDVVIILALGTLHDSHLFPSITFEKHMIYAPSFICGFYIAKYINFEKTSSIKRYTMVSLILASMVIHELLCVLNFIPQMFDVLIVSIIFILTYRFFHSLRTNIPKIVAFFDRDSMGIYIIHHIIIWYSLNFLFIKDFLNFNYICPIVYFTIVISLSWAIAHLLNKYPFTKWTLG